MTHLEKPHNPPALSPHEAANRKAELAGKLRRDVYRGNGRPLLGERNDCAVCALATAMDRPYDEVHRLFAKAGRKPRRGTSHVVMLHVLHTILVYDHVYKAQRVWQSDSNYSYGYGQRRGRYATKGITLAQFARQFRTGRYVVWVARHMVAVIDGVIHDDSYGPRRRVFQAWEVA